MRRRLIRFAFALLAGLAVATSDASAQDRHHRSVPELDPATVGAIAALVAGGGVILARRRKR